MTANQRSQLSEPHTSTPIKWIIVVLLVALVLVVLSKAAAAGARDKVIAEGRQEYAENCVGCHSDDAKGGGELAARLVKPPKDLTIIGAANGGSFPFWRIFAIVSGETPVAGHDTHQMPDYFARLKRNDFKPGYLPAHVRLLELTHYLESIQTK